MLNERPTKRRRLLPSDNSTHVVTAHLKSKYLRGIQFFMTPDTPLIFLSYIKTIYHAVGILVVLFIFYQCLQTFFIDVQERYHYELEELIQKARDCHHNYLSHNCGPEIKGAVWKTYCDEWDNCRNFQSQSVSKSKIMAQVLGECMNGFVDPLSFKSMVK